MAKEGPEYILIQSILVDYRVPVFRLLRASMGPRLQFVAGDKPWAAGQEIVSPDDFEYLLVRNRLLPGNLMIQTVPLRQCIGCKSIVIELNPRLLHVWFIALVRRLLRRPVIFWGHAWPREGRASRTDRLRGMLRQLGSGLVAYTEQQADELKELYPGKSVRAAPNALYYRHQYGFASESARDSILYVGRITHEKKVHLLLDAFERLAEKFPSCRLVIVGDGDAMNSIRQSQQQSRFANRIELLGYINNYEKLRELYSHAIVSAAPGTAGLNIIQSLGFGVPIVIANDAQHGPELSALKAGVNGFLFRSDSSGDLAAKLEEVLLQADIWSEKGRSISDACSSRYSVEAMAETLRQSLLDSNAKE